MKILFYLTIVGLWAASAQENSMANVPKSLLECYNNTYLLNRNNKLPQNVQSLIALLRKIEDNPELNMDLRSLSVALLHRFRQDGIVQNPFVPAQAGVTPYAPNGYQFYRQAETLRLIPGNAIAFPNNSISSVERCSLHSMFSSSIDGMERGDEPSTCRITNSAYRYRNNYRKRSIGQSTKAVEDVETLTPEQLETMNNKDDTDNIDPNSWYPALPPNHPDSARLFALPPMSKCPIENGVIKTEWGPIAGGSILAGIAAGLQPQNVRLGVLLKEEWQSRDALSSTTLDNKWIATVAGDLAEVALRQGPLADTDLKIGVEGHWNSSQMPRWYFLNSNDNLYYTGAEIRGDIDGLVLASGVSDWYSRVPNLKLSQIIDMYYSDRGVFNTTIRACNRKSLFVSMAQNDTITAQAYRSALVLSPGVAKVTIDPATIEKFAVQATEKLFAHIPSMNDPICSDNGAFPRFNRISTDITIFVDTTRPFAEIQTILATLLESLEISKYNSNFTIINAHKDNRIMINSSNTILDLYEFNETQYSSFSKGFDLSRSFDTIISMQASKLDEERRRNLGGSNSEVILFVPYRSTISGPDKEYCIERVKKLREDAPDATLMILTSGAKDEWSDLVRDSTDDIFKIGTSMENQEITGPINDLVARIKRVPRRLINSQCGSNYAESGSLSSHDDYLEPSGINFYKLHPNYFYNPAMEMSPTIEIQASGSMNLNVCWSREALHINSTSKECASVDGRSHSISFNCGDVSFIHECSAMYLSVSVNASTNAVYQCTDDRFCRFPDMVKYTISYKYLSCANDAISVIISPFIVAFFIIFSLIR